MKKITSAFCLIVVLGILPEKLLAIDANTYLSLKENEQGWFLIGVISGIKEISHDGINEDGALTICTKGMPLKQVHAITAKYLAAHPEDWQRDMTKIYKKALGLVC